MAIFFGRLLTGLLEISLFQLFSLYAPFFLFVFFFLAERCAMFCKTLDTASNLLFSKNAFSLSVSS